MKNMKKQVKIIATGGTIAGSGKSSTQTTGYEPGSIKIDEILNEIPAINEIAEISFAQFFNIDSVNMTNKRMLDLARFVQEIIDDNSIHAVIITHGTDTLEEVAYFLHLILNTHKPVIMVGAIRPATSIGSDGLINLYHSLNVAIHPDSAEKGVLIVMNSRILSAKFVTKVNTTMTDAFTALEAGAIGNIVGDNIYYFYNRPNFKHTYETIFNPFDIVDLPKVNIITAHQGDDTILLSSINHKCEGIVLSTAGGYTLSDNMLSGLEKLNSSSFPIVRTSRLGHGIVAKTYLEDNYNLIASETLNANKSRILLMLLLSHKIDLDDFQFYFNNY
ncbi:asparaginase [Staphylococcus kloosii]|jgi:L-asparaginase|uniref:asparaginase n=1 Tax=Staphylococcus kloosii TaxID=29384 RepID=UPI00189D6D9A|nr:asparaginase [Staphylococcus kloosii]MBF7024107.1 asparaginase [Staphylococcus kloosii]